MKAVEIWLEPLGHQKSVPTLIQLQRFEDTRMSANSMHYTPLLRTSLYHRTFPLKGSLIATTLTAGFDNSLGEPMLLFIQFL
jgi:hypothetical protein